ncbi:opine metallophore biosynthesis dehydrogenase [Bacillus sp. V2I10]|uniref:opine metallophore biosynthesis dehydrogenase n=1 Tax=Bacillus sp. V2I10 TaxID=3042276 RepID=UPI0027846EC4|nr:opine metallophore biosynthesis dehydrogenase [Bacillus sp. V2I10]MDQ0857936.1 hypothetical protein [Bacillus sp. V2I10]
MTLHNFIAAPFGNTLIAGAGPAAINIAVQAANGWTDKLGLVNRPGAHTARLINYFNQNGKIVKSRYLTEANAALDGEAKLDIFYGDYRVIDDIWETLIICTPSDSYVEVLNQLFSRKLTRLNKIIFLSPGIGSNILIGRHFQEELKEIELISMSAYYGATKYEEDGINVRTKALKKRIYLASSNKKSGHIHSVSKFIESLRVEARIVSAPIEAESRNVTTYVHPPFFMNSFAMKQILTENQSLKSMYKLYPEGPITQHSIRVMVKLWKEISEVVEYFGAKPINLLQFLNDDNYPVHNETLSREDIEQFQTFSEMKQEYLLYIRYSAILIDPFSRPDEYGRYFDFSAVPFKQAEKDIRGRWAIPRIPLEDYRKLKGIYELGKAAGIEMPHALALIETFVAEVNGFAEKTQEEYSNFDRTIESRLFSGHGRRKL